ncbi:AAA-ATPase At2g18190 [Jatropha curcas]|uniref:AAA-ATPase At2g18190 n=1 Tax=Jatropha curcas TaxID=180498 RepID=UPI001895B7F6|nr:AAA-ATPase At2g18190 [Jatropha curcas]
MSLYASFSTSLMLLRNVYHELVPKKLETFLVSKFLLFFSRRKSSPSYDNFIIDDSWDGLDRNKLIDAARFYLSSKIGPKNKIIKIGKFRGQKNVTAALVEGEKVVDVYEGIEITWQFAKQENDDRSKNDKFYNKGYFELKFEDQYREKIFNGYLNHILDTSKAMTKGEKVLKLYTRSRGGWDSIDFRHPSTFDALAMDHNLKKSIIDDIDRFLARKDYYKRIGKAWKRGYLLYGPPGTGKSSLIAAMANYLKFDVFDLELANITFQLLEKKDNSVTDKSQGSFWTQHCFVLQMDMHHSGDVICTSEGFRVLDKLIEHKLLEEIDGLIQSAEATPASLAEELLKSDDPDVALGEVLNFLKQQRIKKDNEDKIVEEKLEVYY